MFRKFILIFVISDNWINNLIKKSFKSKWVLEGKCKQCGTCCQEIKLYAGPRLIDNKFTYWLIVAWLSWLFQFYLKSVDTRKSYLIFGCRNIGADGKCKVYKWRPNVCRNFPIVDYFDKPVLLPECSYKVKLRARK